MILWKAKKVGSQSRKCFSLLRTEFKIKPNRVDGGVFFLCQTIPAYKEHLDQIVISIQFATLQVMVPQDAYTADLLLYKSFDKMDPWGLIFFFWWKRAKMMFCIEPILPVLYAYSAMLGIATVAESLLTVRKIVTWSPFLLTVYSLPWELRKWLFYLLVRNSLSRTDFLMLSNKISSVSLHNLTEKKELHVMPHMFFFNALNKRKGKVSRFPSYSYLWPFLHDPGSQIKQPEIKNNCSVIKQCVFCLRNLGI